MLAPETSRRTVAARLAATVAVAACTVLGLYSARHRPLINIWSPPSWLADQAATLSLAAFILFAAGALPRGTIKADLRRPQVAGAALLALGHFLVVGDLCSMALFGALIAGSMVVWLNKPRRPLTTPSTEDWKYDLAAIFLGSAAFGVFVRWLHPFLFDVPIISP